MICICCHSSSNHKNKNRFSNNGISVLFTELHEILPNPVYEIPIMKREINKIEFYTQLGICNKTNR